MDLKGFRKNRISNEKPFYKATNGKEKGEAFLPLPQFLLFVFHSSDGNHHPRWGGGFSLLNLVRPGVDATKLVDVSVGFHLGHGNYQLSE